MFSNIVVATDLSPASFAIVNYLGGLRAFGSKQCLLLLCLNFQEAASTALSHTTAPLEGILGRQREILEKQGFKVETRILPGFAKRDINRVAAEESYSLIVVGSQGHSMLGEALLGGVAYAVIHSARKPVLLVPLGMKEDGGDVCVQPARCDFSEHVLFPTDFSENADLAFTFVEKLAGDGARRITLLHVQDRARIASHLAHRLEEFNEIDRGRLEEMKTRLRKKLRKNGNAEVDIEVCYGSPFEEITRLIRERNVHLVVMGSQGRGFVEEVFLGSVSHNVARHAEAPVLLIPADRTHR
ncbi:MAG: universal stress protein [Gammaproteobacteria bacterium]|nr:universal stress protein [Gammaproteobacteria bacterium]